MAPCMPHYHLKEDASLLAMFDPLHSSMNQQLFKITSAIKAAPMKIMDDFHYKWKPSKYVQISLRLDVQLSEYSRLQSKARNEQ